MNKLPRLIIVNIGIYLKVSELVNFKLLNSRINNVVNTDYFWKLKLLRDFNVENENPIETYKNIYQGLLMVYDDGVVPLSKFHQRIDQYTKIGLIALIDFRCEGNGLSKWYIDNWTPIYDDWLNRTDFISNLHNLPDEVFNYFRYFEGTRYYVPPNRLSNWHHKFKIGQEYDIRQADPFSSYISLSRVFSDA